MTYRIEFSPQAEEDLDHLFDYLATVATPETARNYIRSLVTYCSTLVSFP